MNYTIKCGSLILIFSARLIKGTPIHNQSTTKESSQMHA